MLTLTGHFPASGRLRARPRRVLRRHRRQRTTPASGFGGFVRMSWWKRLLVPAALAALIALPAHAQVAGRPLEVSAGAGITSFDARDYIQDSPAFVGSLGWRWKDFLSLEYSFTGS